MCFDNFAIGDRVTATKGNIDNNSLVKKGLGGTVVALDGGRKRVGVQWDVNVGGHSCGTSACPHGFGWWANPMELSIVESPPIDDSLIASTEELFAFIYNS